MIFLKDMEQVHVRGMNRRGLRLELVAALGAALCVPALAMAAENGRGLATQTTLSAETHDIGGHTQASLVVRVAGEDGLAATGSVAIEDRGRQIAGVALSAEGEGKAVLDLAAGSHLLRAIYVGDAGHRTSSSATESVQAQASGTPGFQVSVAPATISLTAGQSGNLTTSITPVNSTALTAPMFVTLSCSGLPAYSSCTFTPENVEILPNATAAVTSSMVLQTQAASASAQPLGRPGASRGAGPIAWALLLPGALGLAGLALPGRRGRWINRLALLGLVSVLTVLGTTACAARYNYFHHPPPANPATPAGTYTVSVTAQSSDGVTATTHSTTTALTVK